MQALSNFTWIPDFIQSQNPHHHHLHHAHAHHEKIMACSKPRPTVMTDLSRFTNLKRKRTESLGSQNNSNNAGSDNTLLALTAENAGPKRPKTSDNSHHAYNSNDSAPAADKLEPANPQSKGRDDLPTTVAAVPAPTRDLTVPRGSNNSAHVSNDAPAQADSHVHGAVTAPLSLPVTTPAVPSVAIDSHAAPSVHEPTPPSPAMPAPSSSQHRDQDSAQYTPIQPSRKLSMQPLKLKNTTESRAKVREIIESQLNLEILLKHQELRLIEQELAKCQVSLEQIRRCQIIPYPGQDGSLATPEQLSTGAGFAVEPSPGFTKPQHPAPWGVTDGPYTRHYAKWLIPDGTFDPTPTQRVSFGGKGVAGPGGLRSSTRGSYFDYGLSASSPRYGRGSVGSKINAAPGTYGAAPIKDRHGPLIIKRPSDGQLVKLVCKFCQKDNISSVQGFLNHCRIAHQKSYESHGEAAEDCGIALDPSDAAAGTTATATTTTTTSNSSSSNNNSTTANPALLTPTAEHRALPLILPSLPASVQATPTSAIASPHCGKPLVHPLIHSSLSNPMQSQTPLRAIAVPNKSKSMKPKTAKSATTKQLSSISPADQPEQFVPALQTPKLSALLQKRGITGNLSRLVTNCQQQCDIDEIQYIGADEEEGDQAQKGDVNVGSVDNSANANPVAAPLSGVAATGRAPSRAGPSSKLQIGGAAMDMAAHSPDTSSPSQQLFSSGVDAQHVPAVVTRHQHRTSSLDAEDSFRAAGMSPHTVDTNPGLTEDESFEPGEDDDEDDLSDSEDADSDGHASPVTDHDAMEVDVEVRGFGGGRNSPHHHPRDPLELGDENDVDNEVKPPPPSQAQPSHQPETTGANAPAPPVLKRKRGRPAKDRNSATPHN